MSWHRRNNPWRRLTAGLLLVAYVTTCAGVVPFQAFAFQKKGDLPFPCQDHPCGCATAEDCWRHCCCFTPEERWAWARDHDVQPPEYAERPAAKSWSTARLRDQAEDQQESHVACDHCQTPLMQGARCEHSEITSCCRTEPASQDHRPVDAASHSHAPALHSVWRCQGLSTLWLSTGAVLPVVPSATWRLYCPCASLIAAWDSRPATVSLVPPDPPPRTL